MESKINFDKLKLQFDDVLNSYQNESKFDFKSKYTNLDIGNLLIDSDFSSFINKQNEIRNIGVNNATNQIGNQLGSQLYLPAAQANFGQLLLSRGGKIYKKKRKTRKIIKHKKTKTNRNKK